MILLLVLLTMVILFTILLFTVKSKVNLIFDSASSDMHLSLLWLYPLLKSEIRRVDNRLIMTIYLLNKRIYNREISSKQNDYSSKSTIKNLNPTDIHVDTSYGFRDPFVTGLAGSAITLVSEFFNVESLHQRPDYLAISDYINLDATAKLNLGRSLMKFV